SRTDCGKELTGFGTMLLGVGRTLPPLPPPLPFCARAGDADARNAANVITTETDSHIFFMGQTSQWRPSTNGHPAVQSGMAKVDRRSRWGLAVDSGWGVRETAQGTGGYSPRTG